MHRIELGNGRGSRWRVDVPSSRRERIRGLRGRTTLRPDEAMLLERCRSVHTIGMRFPVTVAFLDRHRTAIEVHRVPAGRILRPRPRARSVLELPIGADLRVGDRLGSAARRGASARSL